LPIQDLATLVPPISEHNRPRTQLRAFIDAEVTHHLAHQGDKSIGAFLDEYHLRDVLRQQVAEQLDAPVASFIESEGFASWLDALLHDYRSPVDAQSPRTGRTNAPAHPRSLPQTHDRLYRSSFQRALTGFSVTVRSVENTEDTMGS